LRDIISVSSSISYYYFILYY